MSSSVDPNLTQAVVAQRESGELKRLRGTPLPTSFVIASRAAVGVVVAVAMSALLLLIGRLVYDVHIPHSTMVGLVIAVIVGAAAFVCIAFAVSTRIAAADAAAPATNLAVLGFQQPLPPKRCQGIQIVVDA